MNISSWPNYTKQELQAVSRIIKSNRVNYWTGIEGKKFEEEFADFHKVKYAIAVSNGSVALDIALHAIDIKPGDEVIVTPRSYIASVSCVINSKAKPVFVDVDLDTQNMIPEEIQRKITKKTRAIICVHLAGWPCDMSKIINIAKKNNLRVIEDCSQAHGARINNKLVGSFGDIGIFSFCNDKIITTLGEGGMIITNKNSLWRRAWEFKDHGRNWNKVNRIVKNHVFKWIISSFGSNYRLTEIQSAVGRIQLKKLKKWISIRNNNARQLNKICNKYVSIRKIPIPQNIHHAFYKYYIFINKKNLKTGWNRDIIIEEFNRLNIPCFTGSCPEIYRENAFKTINYKIKKRLKNARQLGETSIVFLVHPTLTKLELNRTCKAIKKVFSKITIDN